MQQPTVEMLWEATDPAHALLTRFGFPDAAVAGSWVVDLVAEHWGLTVERCDRIFISSWKALAWVFVDGAPFIVKWSASPARFAALREAASITNWLHERDVPVAVPMPTTDGASLVEVVTPGRRGLRARFHLQGSRFLIGMLPVLPGELLDIDNERHVVHAGEMLAAVHVALARYPSGRRRNLDEQLIHNDFRSANVLHDGTRITGVLDLEEAKIGSRVADVAKAAVMLGTKYRNWVPTRPEVRRHFVESYSARLPLTPADRRELERRMTAVLAARWWASHAADGPPPTSDP